MTMPLKINGLSSMLLVLVVASNGSAQGNSFKEGTHAFRAVLRETGFNPVSSLKELAEEPKRSLLVILGDCDSFADLLVDRQLTGLMNSGVAVLYASDIATPRVIADQVPVRVDGRKIVLNGPPDEIYRKSLVDCPIMQLKSSTDFPTGIHVATNAPSFLRTRLQEPWRIAAELPAGCRHYGGGHFLSFSKPPPLAFMHPDKRFLVIADHSIFINDMMLQVDNDNILFAASVANWLKEGKRDRILFVEDNQIITDFNSALDYIDPPLPPIEAIVPIANAAITALEEENIFNRMLLDIFPHRQWMRIYALIGISVLAALGMWKLLHSRKRVDSNTPRLPEQLSELHDPAPAHEQQRKALLKSGDLSVAARHLALQTFEQLGHGDAGTFAPPPFTVHATWWQRRRWAKEIRGLWQFVHGNTRTVSPPRLENIGRRLVALTEAVQRGTVQFRSVQ